MTYPNYSNSGYYYPHYQQPPESPNTSRRWWWVAGVAGLVLIGLIVTMVIVLSGESSDSRLQVARDTCTAGQLGDEGETLILDMEGDDSGGLSFDDVTCVLAELGIPTHIAARMDSTRALDGTQDAEWDGITASWTYHPGAGMDIILTLDQE